MANRIATAMTIAIALVTDGKMAHSTNYLLKLSIHLQQVSRDLEWMDR
jgi:hypothetical protein